MSTVSMMSELLKCIHLMASALWVTIEAALTLPLTKVSEWVRGSQDPGQQPPSLIALP